MLVIITDDILHMNLNYDWKEFSKSSSELPRGYFVRQNNFWAQAYLFYSSTQEISL